MVIVIGLLAGGLGIGCFRPVLAAFITIVLSLGIAAAFAGWSGTGKFGLLVDPSGGANAVWPPWAVGSQYLLESRRRKARKAFGLSRRKWRIGFPVRFGLQQGGKVVDASVMFTDLENFTTLSESGPGGGLIHSDCLL